jgi:hypothetical protein
MLVALLAAALLRAGASMRLVAIVAFATGLAASVSIALHFYLAGLVLLIANLLVNGLLAAVERLSAVIEPPLFLAFDAVAIATVPVAFAVADPSRALAAAFLLLGFTICGSASLAQTKLSSRGVTAATTLGLLSFHGLSGGRVVIFLGFAVACLKHDWFSLAAYVLGALSIAAAGTWIAAAITDHES